MRVLPKVAPEHEYVLYSREPIPAGELPDFPNLSYRVVPAANERLWTLFALPHALQREAADLLHVQYTAPPRYLCPCPIVTTVHDISFRLYPQWFPLRHRLLMNLTVPASMRQAARVITDSESSRLDIIRCYGLPARKIAAIPLGLPEGFADEDGRSYEARQETARCITKERFALDKPFVLAVGVLQPRKNLPMLAEAFGRAKVKFCLPHQLAIVGKIGWGTGQETLRQAAERGGGKTATDALVFTGYVDDADLPTLYRACDVFAYPSLYEGFGFPPLEAMACSAPVLVSDAPCLPEFAGDVAQIVPATDVNAWAEMLGTMLGSPERRRDLALRGPAHAARFTWEATAERTIAVYQEAVARAKR